MSLFKVFDIAGSAVSAQGMRLNTVASNHANAESVAGPGNAPYRARQVVFETVPLGGAGPGEAGVRVRAVVEDPSPGRRVHDPGHPMADAAGYVTLPNVSVADEMVNMISAARAYEQNVEVMNTAKALLLKTLNLGS